VDDDLRVFIADMFETMYDAPGIGLAAIQVGLAKRVLVIDLQDKDEETGKTIKDPRVFINPEILEESEELSVYSEGCLSVPEQYADVARPAVIKAKWLDADGTEHVEQIDGLLATCLQHEMDHLNGILFIDHLSKLKRDIVLKKLAKARKMAA
jgi:peptide deformylase